MRVLIRSPLDTLHTLIVLSQDPDPKYSPFKENITLVTKEEWPLKFLIPSPLDIFHSLIVLSLDSDTK